MTAPGILTDPEAYRVLGRSLFVSGSATLLAMVVGIPLGVVLGSRAVPGRRALVLLINTLLGLPTVLVGLAAVLLLGREGPLGSLRLLYTPAAMIAAQATIAFPVVTAFTISAIQAVDPRIALQLRALGASRIQELGWLARHARLGLLVAIMAAFGTAASEVGAALMVGGNLKGYTRVLTTATLLEARMGRFETAIALAILLLFIALVVNGTLTFLQQRRAGPAADVHGIGDVPSGAVQGSTSREIALRADELTKSYDGRRVLDIEELEVRFGETLAILGPNGAGKSTLLRILACIEPPDRGRVSVAGAAERSVLAIRRRLAYVPQDPPMLDATVAANVEAALRLRGVSASERMERARHWLKVVGVDHLASANAQQLSGGEARRVALARALVCDPSVLLIDEPFVSLDPPTRDAFISVVQDVVRGDDRTTVIVTQDRDEALRLAHRVAFLWDGRIEQIGSVPELMHAPRTPRLARFLGTDTVVSGEVDRSSQGVTWVRVGDRELQIAGDQEPGAKLWLCIRPENVTVRAVGAAAASTARNALKGVITSIERTSSYERVSMDVGFPLVAAVTGLSVSELGLEVGSEVEGIVKATAVHTIPAGLGTRPRP